MLVVGLGNPGSEYVRTRHNAGFLVVEYLAEKLECAFRKPFLRAYEMARGVFENETVFLVKPLTYMNRSGEVLATVLRTTGCRVDDLVVVCDNLDLPIGSCRVRRHGSSAGHNGLASVISYAGTDDFRRVYLGIGRPHGAGVVDYVLGEPEGEEVGLLAGAVDVASKAVLALVSQPIERVMNEVNRR